MIPTQEAFNQIAMALARHFVSLYYIDIETGNYCEYIPHSNLKSAISSFKASFSSLIAIPSVMAAQKSLKVSPAFFTKDWAGAPTDWTGLRIFLTGLFGSRLKTAHAANTSRTTSAINHLDFNSFFKIISG